MTQFFFVWLALILSSSSLLANVCLSEQRILNKEVARAPRCRQDLDDSFRVMRAKENSQNTELRNIFQHIYAVNKKNDVVATQPRIPLKIHQIWIGPRPVPEKFLWLMESWKKHHPEWEYKLWTNADLEKFPFVNKAAFDATPNWGMKSDILRYEILYQYGGLYVDLDFECRAPFDLLHYQYDFYTGLCSPHEICNALIAAAPGSPVMAKTVDSITNKFEAMNHKFPTDAMGILYTTGPIFFTNLVADCWKSSSDENRDIMVFPIEYFYAFPNSKREDFWRGRMTQDQINAYFKPETMGVHYWATSWL